MLKSNENIQFVQQLTQTNSAKYQVTLKIFIVLNKSKQLRKIYGSAEINDFVNNGMQLTIQLLEQF